MTREFTWPCVPFAALPRSQEFDSPNSPEEKAALSPNSPGSRAGVDFPLLQHTDQDRV